MESSCPDAIRRPDGSAQTEAKALPVERNTQHYFQVLGAYGFEDTWIYRTGILNVKPINNY